MTESKATAAGNNVTHLGESTVAYADGEGGPGDRVVSFRAADVVVSAGYPPGRYDDYEVVIGVILGAPPPGDALVWLDQSNLYAEVDDLYFFPDSPLLPPVSFDRACIRHMAPGMDQPAVFLYATGMVVHSPAV